jgi:beta-lactamase superfamily II metal-dependent hydrolase
MSLRLLCLKARNGDCFLLFDEKNEIKFLIDCGFKLTYKTEIKKIVRDVDFIILTHVDEDHINGAIPLIEDYPEDFQVGHIYINTPASVNRTRSSGNISIKQAITLEDILQEKKIPYSGLKEGDIINVSADLSLEVISPGEIQLTNFLNKFEEEINYITKTTPVSINHKLESIQELSEKPDSYISQKSDFVNASSIALILNYKTKRLLFLGDAHPSVILNYLNKKGFSKENKCDFDYIKLSHHGSVKSISNNLISILKCSDFIVSTNGGKSVSKHPSRETLAKLITKIDRNNNDHINFYFNYPPNEISARNGPLLTKSECKEFCVNLVHKNEITIQ